MQNSTGTEDHSEGGGGTVNAFKSRIMLPVVQVYVELLRTAKPSSRRSAETFITLAYTV